uniref:Fibronectin type-III domain-containing protein n=1 Tax=Mesocestoides corti TaxID=53468 RepID=A0A5K3G3I5_MESCO
DTGIGRYAVTVVGVVPIKSCTIPRGGKLECRLEGLRSATQYEVAVSSCISGTDPAVCSESLKASGSTQLSSPKGVNVTPLSTTSMKVTVVPPDDATNILRYDV